MFINSNSYTIIGIFATIFGVFCNASAGIFVRVIFENNDLNLITATMYRFAISSPIIFIYLYFVGHKFTKLTIKDITLIIFGGIFFSLGVIFYNYSFVYTTMANANLFSNLLPLVVVPMSAFLFKEKIPLSFLIPVLISSIGIILIIYNFNNNDTGNLNSNLLGDVMAFMVSIIYGSYIIIITSLRQKLSTMELMFYCTSIAALILILFSYSIDSYFIPKYSNTIGALFGLSFITHLAGAVVIAFGAGFISPSLASMLIMSQPIAGVIYGNLLYSESVLPQQLLGIIITILGIIYAQIIISNKQKHNLSVIIKK